MASIGHIAVGLSAARARGGRLGEWLAWPALAVAADLDVIAFRLGVPYAAPFGHRRATHSLAFAAVLAVLYVLALHRELRPLSRAWWVLFGVAFAAGASHGLLDACTDGGLGVAWQKHRARAGEHRGGELSAGE